jgi:uncharacterized protein (DUF1697 family)
MAWVVFFRAVNVGGHQTFRPGLLAKELAEFDVVNLGAAGTFVVRGKITEAKLRDEILRRLPFQPELMICPARDVLALARTGAFGVAPAGKDIQKFVTVMLRAPAPGQDAPQLPHDQPAGAKWEIRVARVIGQFALSFRCPRIRGTFYPNAVVEKHFGIPATTRNWNTIVAIHELLEK